MLTLKSDRQHKAVAMVPFGFADFGASGVAEKAVELPQDAVVLGGSMVIDTAFDSVTSDTLTVGDGASDARYKAAIDGQALGLTALVGTGHKYTQADSVDIKWTGVGAAPTVGAGRLFIEYMVEGRSQFNQG